MEDPSLDESADALRYSVAIGSAHEVRTLRAAHIGELLDEAVAATCEPLADEGILPALLVSRLAREKVTAVLSGEGGDELFWGYYPRQSAMLAAGMQPAHFGHRYLSYFADFTRTQFSACFPELAWWPDGEPGFDVARPADPAESVRSIEYHLYLPFVLLKADRASMHHSLEVRVPLLDRAVIDVASGLCAADCLDLSASTGKAPLRRALNHAVGFATQGKRGFTAPIDTWVRTVLREPVASSLERLEGLETIDVDTRALTGMFRRHCRGEENNGMALWRMMCLDMWAAKQRVAVDKWAETCGC
jgi:asparagine synthase (glutamine-hydrolysing)